MSSKPVNLHVFHPSSNKKRVVEASRDSIVETIKNLFEIEDDIVMRQKNEAGSWEKVDAETVRDITEVRIYSIDEPGPDSKNAGEAENKELTFQQNLKVKLVNNEILTGKDRQYLCSLLEKAMDHEKSPAAKRLLFEDFPNEKPKRKRVNSDSSASTVVNEQCSPVSEDTIKKSDTDTASTSSSKNVSSKKNNERKKKVIKDEESSIDKENSGEELQKNKDTADKGVQIDVKLKDYSQVKAFLREQERLPVAERDQQSISQILAVTFEQRRDYIMKEQPTVKSVKETYGTLFEKTLLLEEFSRIVGFEVSSVFYENLNTYHSALQQCADKSNPMRKLIEKMVKKAKTEEEKKYINLTGSLLLLPSLLKEDAANLVQFSSKVPGTDYPVILCDSPLDQIFFGEHTFSVYAEAIYIVQTTDYIEAVLLLMAIHYCFDMEYQPQLSKTAQAIEHLLLKIKLEGPLLSAVKKLSARVLKH